MAKKFDLEGARKAGYSDAEISSYLSKSNPDFDMQSAIQSGYSPAEINEYLYEREQPSKTRSVLSAPVKGYLKGARKLTIDPFQALLNQSSPLIKAQENAAEEILPTRPEETENILERAGELGAYATGGGEGLGLRALEAGSGALAGYAAEQAGLGEGGQLAAEIGGMLTPAGVRGAGRKIKGLFGKEIEKLPSGLSKIKALEAKKPELAKLTAEKQKRVSDKLNAEAAELTKMSVKKHLPIVEEIEKNFDFPQHFEKGFGELQKMAEKANPEIDITPISSLFSQIREKYRGIPTLHSDALKVAKEIKNFSNRPQTGLKNLLRIYRSNNQKIKHIAETASTGGRQSEYVDFLLDMNRNIAKSFENTLPAESPWMTRFKDLNRQYGAYQGAKKTLNTLKPLIGSKPTPSTIEKLATDEKAFKKLALSMGEEGAKEVRQIAKDLKASMDAIKKIPVADLTMFDRVFGLSYLIPGFKIPAIVIDAVKAKKYGGYLYGYYLSSPSRRKAYQESLRALINKDIHSYIKSTTILKNELGELETNSSSQ